MNSIKEAYRNVSCVLHTRTAVNWHAVASQLETLGSHVQNGQICLLGFSVGFDWRCSVATCALRDPDYYWWVPMHAANLSRVLFLSQVKHLWPRGIFHWRAHRIDNSQVCQQKGINHMWWNLPLADTAARDILTTRRWPVCFFSIKLPKNCELYICR